MNRDIETEERTEEALRTARHGLPTTAPAPRITCRPEVPYGRCWSRGCMSCNAQRVAERILARR